MTPIKTLLLVTFLALPLQMLASEGDTQVRTIELLGCHLGDGTCYFRVDGGAVGPAHCLSNTIRFNSKTSENGDVWISMLMGAYLAEAKVVLNIQGCYQGHPTFTYGYLWKPS